MIRSLKALGLALVAVFALGATLASVASAQGVITTEGAENVTLTAEEASPGVEFLEAFSVKVKCPGSACTSSTVAAAANTFPATVTTNGCDYDIRVGGTLAASTYSGQAAVTCPGSAKIEVKLGSRPEPRNDLTVVHRHDRRLAGLAG